MNQRIITMAAVLLLIMTSGCAGGGRNLATAPPPGQQKDAVLVVNVNLTELFDDQDVRDHEDLQRFAERLHAQVPHAPDVFLLQEVRLASAIALIEILEQVFADDFQLAYRPGRHVWNREHGTMRAIGIVTNRRTMRVLKTDSLRTRYPLAQATPPGRATNKLVGLAHLQRRGGIEIAVASLHLPPDRNFLDPQNAHAHRARWVERVARRTAALGGDAVRVVAGDFNSARCLNHSWHDCEVAPFWSALVDEPNAVPDARQTFKARVGWRRAPSSGVDHIFTDGFVWNYQIDAAYQKSEFDYYSDHRFRWALVGSRR